NATAKDIPGANGIFIPERLPPSLLLTINIAINVINDDEKTINGIQLIPNHAAIAEKNLISPPPIACFLHAQLIILENKCNKIKTKIALLTDSSRDTNPLFRLKTIPIINNDHVNTSGIFFVSKSIKETVTENTLMINQPINK
ncbi:hypothetical protein EDY49_25510, partial [Salmonella enterica]|nr:hypothetical protein [Salmonella enterica]